jgi:phosphate ABC transporter phosphate-binding protein
MIRRRPRTALTTVAMLLGAAGAVGGGVIGAPPAAAAGPTVVGAGSTWSQIAIDQWRADVNRLGISINYQGVGSTQGRQFFANSSVDFGVSEIPYQPDGEPQPNRGYEYLPIVAGGTSMMYNLKSSSGAQIRNLTLSPTTLALIFTGKIRTWGDKRIKADYRGSLPNIPIKLIVRSDGSGTSAQFTRFLHEVTPSIWDPFVRSCGVSGTPPDGISFYPTGSCLPNAVSVRGSDGIANYVSNPGLGVGAIGYVEAGYAIARRLPVVGLKNKAGNYALPTATNVAIALQHASLRANHTAELSKVYRAPEAYAYPMSSYSYMIVPTDSSITTSKGAVLGSFIRYFACTGQQVAERLGYSPLPRQLVQFAFNAMKEIPGAPSPPALTGAACPNPTLTGSFKPGSGADNVLPGTDLSGGGDGNGGTGDGDGGGGGGGGTGGSGSGTDGSGGGTGSGSGTFGGSVTGATGTAGLSGVPGVTTGADGQVIATYAPDVIDPSSLGPLKRAARERIEGLDRAGAWPLAMAAIVILAIVFGPLILRMRRGDRPS